MLEEKLATYCLNALENRKLSLNRKCKILPLGTGCYTTITYVSICLSIPRLCLLTSISDPRKDLRGWVDKENK